MTMNLHTPTTAPKAAPATSVSPLEQSGSPKTKFPEIKTVKTAVVKLISDIEGQPRSASGISRGRRGIVPGGGQPDNPVHAFTQYRADAT